MWGAGGGATGGGGGYTVGTILVTPGQVLTVIVGQAGFASLSNSTYGGGGSSAYLFEGSGGGRSAIRNASGVELLTAGAGGGGAYGTIGGAGGGSSGEAGNHPIGGTGGTQTAGGNNPVNFATPGFHYRGGSGFLGGGPGGGSGWYGGGGGYGTAGGGGSGYCGGAGVSNCTTTTGVAATPANSGDTDRAGAGSPGANGIAVVTWTDPPPLQCDGNAHTYPTGTYTVPTYNTVIVEAWGGGASGAGGNGYLTTIAGNPGTQSSFVGVTAGGGIGPAAGTGSGGLTGGGGGTASGGDTNTSGGSGANGWADFCPVTSGAGGSSPNGGSGGAGISTNVPSNPGGAPGGGGGGGLGAQYQSQQGLWYCRGTPGGGAGAYSKKTYTPGALTPGSSVNVTVGSGGAAPSAAGPGGAGAAGQVKVTCSATPINQPPSNPTLTTSPSSPIAGTSYTYGFTSTDNDPGDRLRYAIDWDNDGVVNEYIPANVPPYLASGTEGTVSHATSTPGTMTFKAQAIDNKGSASGWATFTKTIVPPAPTILFTTTSNSYVQGNPAITLTWSSSNASSCTASASPATSDWSGAKPLGTPTASTATVTPTQATTYTLTCSGTTAPSATASIPISYSCPTSIIYSCTGAGNATIRKTEVSAACATTITDFTPACLSPQFCQAGSAQCIDPTPAFNGVGSYTGHLQLIPSIVRKGDTSTAHWNVGNVTSCTVKGDVVDQTGWSGKSGTQVTSNIFSRTTYTLDCLKSDNSHLRESAIVNIVPVFREK